MTTKSDLERFVDAHVLLIEPFYGGSHKQLINLLQNELETQHIRYDLYTLPAKKWHWRARCSALYFSQVIQKPPHHYKVLFASSVLNLAELVSLRPDLFHVKKIIYFHENQLIYPVQKEATRNKSTIVNKDQRDFQYGYNQILTSLVADKVLFNSNFNKRSFLDTIGTHLKQMPDFVPRINVKLSLEPKSSTCYFPIQIDQNEIDSILIESTLNELIGHSNYDSYQSRPLHILWNHRWEHDKYPELFFQTMLKLDESGIDFRLHVVGEQFNEIPPIFNEAKEKLAKKIEDWGYKATRVDYYRVLSKCDVVISTSLHEFFGVALIEACLFGAYPLLPNRLVYPEIYPSECLYSTEAQLFKKLKYFCTRPKMFRQTRQSAQLSSKNRANDTSRKSNSSDSISVAVDKPSFFNKYKWSSLKNEFVSLLTQS